MFAIIDDFSPTAIEERGGEVRVFFSAPDARNAAAVALAAARYSVASIDVDDEDWARRSQLSLGPITIGRITISPNRESPDSVVSGPHEPADSRTSHPQAISIVITPSMGFGTGHHATTRLCLAALQAIDVDDRVALDIGTGSGVLAIAAARLGAADVLGIDNDPDAIQSANENLALNPEVRQVRFREADLTSADLPRADVITANLTGALLARAAPLMLAAVRPGGTIIVGGMLCDERSSVCSAYRPAEMVWEGQEEEWLGLALRMRSVK
jgi:ribosomal protein L11 methyltransferase